MENKYKAFGTELTAESWAKQLKMPVQLFEYVIELGGTVEEMFSRVDKYPSILGRLSGPMLVTRDRMNIILIMSGVLAVDDDKNSIRVETIGTNGVHQISYRGDVIGKYQYRIGLLRLTSGEGINLNTFEDRLDEVTIRKNAAGKWVLSERTKLMMMSAANPVLMEGDEEE